MVEHESGDETFNTDQEAGRHINVDVPHEICKHRARDHREDPYPRLDYPIIVFSFTLQIPIGQSLQRTRRMDEEWKGHILEKLVYPDRPSELSGGLKSAHMSYTDIHDEKTRHTRPTSRIL